jgi:hypothetical protein
VKDVVWADKEDVGGGSLSLPFWVEVDSTPDGSLTRQIRASTSVK